MSLIALPDPANWPAGRRRLSWLTLVVGLFIAVGVFFGTRDVRGGDYLRAIVDFGLGLPFLLVIIAVNLVAGGRTSLRASHNSTGTTLRSDRIFDTLALITFFVCIPLGIVFVIFTLTGDLEMFPSRRGQVGAMVLMTLATGTAVAGLASAWRRGGVGYVKVTPSGIEIADILRTQSVLWGEVVDIADHSETNKKTRKAIVFGLTDGRETTIDGADFYVPRGVGLYWMVQHYWRHPDDRVELTDDRALRRLDEGRFDTSVP
jgi:hypothetical protein